jgi:uncharacterized RDD family membrane protein YckC
MTEPVRPGYAGYAGAVSRAIAFVVDVGVVAVVAIGAVGVVEVIGLVLGAQARDLAQAIAPIFVIALPAMLVLYSTVFWALAGRTPGMALLGIRVVTMGGRPVSWMSSLIRAVVLVCLPIGALWSIADRRRQAVHDKLARTTVVHVASGSSSTRSVGRAAAGTRR